MNIKNLFHKPYSGGGHGGGMVCKFDGIVLILMGFEFQEYENYP